MEITWLLRMVYIIAEMNYSYVESILYDYKIPVCFIARNIVQHSGARYD